MTVIFSKQFYGSMHFLLVKEQTYGDMNFGKIYHDALLNKKPLSEL